MPQFHICAPQSQFKVTAEVKHSLTTCSGTDVDHQESSMRQSLWDLVMHPAAHCSPSPRIVGLMLTGQSDISVHTELPCAPPAMRLLITNLQLRPDPDSQDRLKPDPENQQHLQTPELHVCNGSRLVIRHAAQHYELLHV